MDVFAELRRFIEPFRPSVIEAALLGLPSAFDHDGAWRTHHHGRPRTDRADAFDGAALLAGMQTVCFLGTYLPPGDPMRRAVPGLYRKIVERLANPELMLYGGRAVKIEGAAFAPRGYETYAHHAGIDGGGLVTAHGYTYLRPARMTPADHVTATAACQLDYPNQVFPWAGYLHVLQAVTLPGVVALVDRAGNTPIVAGARELDPRASAPVLVATVAKARAIDEDAATLYLQLLALADCGDRDLCEVNGWTATRHKRAADQLVGAGLVKAHKEPRANRKYVLSGTWEKLFAPHPAIERWKLELYGARMQGKGLAAPLGRLVPLQPIHELFAAAWDRVSSNDAPEANRPTIAVGRDWISDIRAAPDDDALRMVYGDWLTEQGDPRGELVTIQCRRAQLARADVIDHVALDEVVAAEAALIGRHGDVWRERIHSFVEQVHYDRGFITGITVHAPTFVKHAKSISDALPLLTALQLSAGPVGPIPRAHLVALGSCEAFSRIERLDLTPDHYLKSPAELELLLSAPQLPRLRWLRLGFHRGGEGFGKRGAEMLAGCARLAELRFLEVAGQNLGLGGVTALVNAEQFTQLEMLRVPYNALRSPGVTRLVALLEAGALPALRVLDVSNVVETTFVTNACKVHANRVEIEPQRALVHVLATRRH